MPKTTGRRASVLAALLLIPLAGCGSRSPGNYVPQSANARAALEAALNAWKNGEPVGAVKGHKPPIEVIDSARKPGDKLAGYEITAEDTNPDGHHRFTVKLTMQQSSDAREAHFVVLGLDPLWVYREEDYKKLSGM